MSTPDLLPTLNSQLFDNGSNLKFLIDQNSAEAPAALPTPQEDREKVLARRAENKELLNALVGGPSVDSADTRTIGSITRDIMPKELAPTDAQTPGATGDSRHDASYSDPDSIVTQELDLPATQKFRHDTPFNRYLREKAGTKIGRLAVPHFGGNFHNAAAFAFNVYNELRPSRPADNQLQPSPEHPDQTEEELRPYLDYAEKYMRDVTNTPEGDKLDQADAARQVFLKQGLTSEALKHFKLTDKTLAEDGLYQVATYLQDISVPPTDETGHHTIDREARRQFIDSRNEAAQEAIRRKGRLWKTGSAIVRRALGKIVENRATDTVTLYPESAGYLDKLPPVENATDHTNLDFEVGDSAEGKEPIREKPLWLVPPLPTDTELKNQPQRSRATILQAVALAGLTLASAVALNKNTGNAPAELAASEASITPITARASGDFTPVAEQVPTDTGVLSMGANSATPTLDINNSGSEELESSSSAAATENTQTRTIAKFDQAPDQLQLAQDIAAENPSITPVELLAQITNTSESDAMDRINNAVHKLNTNENATDDILVLDADDRSIDNDGDDTNNMIAPENILILQPDGSYIFGGPLSSIDLLHNLGIAI